MRVAALLVVLASCGGPPSRPDGPPPEYPGALVAAGELVSPEGLGEGFALEQTVRSIYPDGEQSFRAVLQRRGAELVLVGFGPHGGRGFVLRQDGAEVSFESHLPGELPFPPEFMLHDVQRTWFIGLPRPATNGEHTGTVAGETVTERWEGGRLMERTFARDDREGTIRVDYGTGLGDDAPPEVVNLHNGWFGYRLELTTLSHHVLPPEGDEEVRSEGAAPAP